MLGLFMVLPLFAVYAEALAGASVASIGLALGAYGLTQAVLQVPLGWLSDQIGRKPVIVGGLTLLILGSVVAALADTLTWLPSVVYCKDRVPSPLRPWHWQRITHALSSAPKPLPLSAPALGFPLLWHWCWVLFWPLGVGCLACSKRPPS